jgi:hypothetical protein
MGRSLARSGILVATRATTVLAAIVLAAPLAVLAQDTTATPTPSALCSVLTPQEVEAALGVAVTVGSSSKTDCSWDADRDLSDISLNVNRDTGNLDFDVRTVFDGEDVAVGDAQGYLLSDDPVLYVGLDDDLLLGVQVYGTLPDAVDASTALVQLATLVLPRLEDLPIAPGPSEEPEPSVFRDPTLEALMPTEVGGAFVDVESVQGAELPALLDADDPDIANALADLEAALGSQGVGFDDLTIAVGTFPTETSSGLLIAIRATTADVAALVDPMVAAWFPALADGIRTTSTVGGHEVLRITDRLASGGPPDPSADPFALPVPPLDVLRSDGVLWMVSVEDPLAAEAIGLIP